jgi:hypothetical protein
VLWYVASRSDRDNVNVHGVTLDAGLDGELHGESGQPRASGGTWLGNDAIDNESKVK